MIWRHYVYEHVSLETGEVFYVGKGAFRKNRKPLYERAAAKDRRNRVWQAIAACGYRIDIIAHFLTDEDACAFEISRIRELGRAGLANFTDGGEGRRNGVFSEAERKKRSENAKGKRPEAWVQSIRRARHKGGNGGVVKCGDKLPEQWRRNIAATKFGDKNPMKGRAGDRHPTARSVIDTDTGERFESITAAAAARGIKVQSLHERLTGRRPNGTSMRLEHGA